MTISPLGASVNSAARVGKRSALHLLVKFCKFAGNRGFAGRAEDGGEISERRAETLRRFENHQARRHGL